MLLPQHSQHGSLSRPPLRVPVFEIGFLINKLSPGKSVSSFSPIRILKRRGDVVGSGHPRQREDSSEDGRV
ncbi:hypothetical protein KUCAC02_015988 [Chaenocephalus aceratus]|uniref:Uncharacterized protein n=1 Tax=Chaenocephalus aceratus TaxID=36190 RepID=A0ACB9Y003_CHAAC|nr:hypothetical protein KUCAC02_015988 [Chaenocephalus aceratus]